MAYATQADMEALHGVQWVRSRANWTEADEIDTASVATALQNASEDIDSYLRGRYELPIAGTVPGVLRNTAIAIAGYMMASGSGEVTEDTRKRYEDRIAFLRDVRDGKTILDLPKPAEPVDTPSDLAPVPKATFATVVRH